nr:uncharacterized protein LOC109175178 [Ipomoea batatas]
MFPIIASKPYYMIYFDRIMERFDAIDNSSTAAKTKDKYGVVPATLKKFFSMFLGSLKSSYKAEKVKKLKIKRMRMPWRDAHNKVDCGIFLMRHLETFIGQTVDEWDSGLQKDNKTQLNNLRIKYFTALVTSDLNKHKGRNIQQAVEFGLRS